MASMRVAGSIRDWFNARDVRRMVRRQSFPDPFVRHYIDSAEYGKDEASLQAIGYMAVAKDVTPFDEAGMVKPTWVGVTSLATAI